MNQDTVIRVENLSKRYLIGHERPSQGADTFREMLVRNVRRLGLTATLVIPALSAAGDRLAAQTPDVPQKVA